MPKIFEYRNIDFVIYPEDHEPPHCHALKDGIRARLFIENIGGVIIPRIEPITKKKYNHTDKGIIMEFGRVLGVRILEKWGIFINQKKPVTCEKIRTLKKSRKKSR